MAWLKGVWARFKRWVARQAEPDPPVMLCGLIHALDAEEHEGMLRSLSREQIVGMYVPVELEVKLLFASGRELNIQVSPGADAAMVSYNTAAGVVISDVMITRK